MDGGQGDVWGYGQNFRVCEYAFYKLENRKQKSAAGFPVSHCSG